MGCKCVDCDVSRCYKNPNYKKPEKAKKEEDKKYLDLAIYLRDKILNNGTEAVFSDNQMKKWAREMRLLVEVNKKTEHQIRAKIDGIFCDDFWKDVIRSAGTLRERWNEGKLDRVGGNNDVIYTMKDENSSAILATPWDLLCLKQSSPCLYFYNAIAGTYRKLYNENLHEKYSIKCDDPVLIAPIYNDFVAKGQFNDHAESRVLELIKKIAAAESGW